MNTYVLDSKNMFFATVIVKYESSWNSEVKEYLPQEFSVVNFILNIKQDKYIVRTTSLRTKVKPQPSSALKELQIMINKISQLNQKLIGNRNIHKSSEWCNLIRISFLQKNKKIHYRQLINY